MGFLHILQEFCELHGSDYMEMLLYISVRWLSLEMCITRILQQYGPLTSYFKSLSSSHIILALARDSYILYIYPILTTYLFADEKQPRFRRLEEAFSNPLTEVYHLFLQATFPVLSTLNLLLQGEKVSIFQLYEEVFCIFGYFDVSFLKCNTPVKYRLCYFVKKDS